MKEAVLNNWFLIQKGFVNATSNKHRVVETWVKKKNAYSQGSKLTGVQGTLAPEFSKWPPCFRGRGSKGPPNFSNLLNIYILGPPDFGLGPQVFKSGGPRAPARTIEFLALYSRFWRFLAILDSLDTRPEVFRTWLFLVSYLHLPCWIWVNSTI